MAGRISGVWAAVFAAAVVLWSPNVALAVEESLASLRAAFEDARQRAAPQTRFAFTRTVENPMTGGRITARFDPARPEAERWVLMSPTPDRLDRPSRRLWEALQENVDADMRLALDRPETLAAEDVVFDRTQAGVAVFQGGLPSAAMRSRQARSPAVQRSVRSELFVDHATGLLVGYRVFAPEAFRPNVASYITRFERDAVIGEAWPGGPMVELRRSQTVEGSAVFVAIARNETVVNQDFAPVD